MATTYLGIEFGSGSMYEYSKTSKEGFESHISSKGNESFRRYERKGITGELLNVGIRTTKFGDNINISQKLEDGSIVSTQFNLFDQSFNVDGAFAESFIRYVGALQKGVTYKIQSYSLSPEFQEESDIKAGGEVKSKYYVKRGISIKLEDGTKVSPTLFYGGDDTENLIPSIVWKDHPTQKNKKMPSAASTEIKTEFLVKKLKEAIDNGLAYESSSSNTTSTQPTTEVESTPSVTEEDTEVYRDYDDLPF